MDRTGPEAAFVVGAVSQYTGASIAVGLFEHLSPGAVALLRVAGAAALLLIIRRWMAPAADATPHRQFDRPRLAWTAAFGVALAGMNLLIYLAIDTLALGTAVAIELLGPIAVAAATTRTLRNAAGLAIALGGVALLVEVRSVGSGAGIGFALGAGAMWAAYIVLGSKVARAGAHIDGLAMATAIGAVAIVPFGAGGLGALGGRPWLLIIALSTSLLSNVIPYGLDQAILRRISTGRFALLQAVLPVTAAAIGFILLRQRPSAGEAAGIALVVIALAIRTRDRPDRLGRWASPL